MSISFINVCCLAVSPAQHLPISYSEHPTAESYKERKHLQTVTFDWPRKNLKWMLWGKNKNADGNWLMQIWQHTFQWVKLTNVFGLCCSKWLHLLEQHTLQPHTYGHLWIESKLDHTFAPPQNNTPSEEAIYFFHQISIFGCTIYGAAETEPEAMI